MTLPLIYALQKTDSSTRKHIIQLIKKESDDSNKVREVINFVKSTGGLAYANKKMNEVAEEARAVLATFPASEYRNSLGDLLSYTIERNK
jgi:octaprenyl-diphosphate synthase